MHIEQQPQKQHRAKRKGKGKAWDCGQSFKSVVGHNLPCHVCHNDSSWPIAHAVGFGALWHGVKGWPLLTIFLLHGVGLLLAVFVVGSNKKPTLKSMGFSDSIFLFRKIDRFCFIVYPRTKKLSE